VTTPLLARARPVVVYLLLTAIGVAAFLYPFWLPGAALPDAAHAGDAPLVAASVGVLVLAALALEVRRGTMQGATVAILGVLAASAGLLRLLDLPGGGSGIFFLIVLAGAAFGPRFGLLLGLTSMAVSAIVTGGIGPWLPFQTLALGWMGAGAGFLGLVTRRMRPWAEVVALAAYGWLWGFTYGAILNLWFWPFLTTDAGFPPGLSYIPGADVAVNLQHWILFSLTTSLGFDIPRAALAVTLVLVAGRPVLTALRRASRRAAFEVPVRFEDAGPASPAGPRA